MYIYIYIYVYIYIYIYIHIYILNDLLSIDIELLRREGCPPLRVWGLGWRINDPPPLSVALALVAERQR